ncbi:DUF3426 domain-containing protein [Gammaproteobacteria bacterium]|nr:DUF3426 domain-containing protein [Gammaproteobacteria bacterium]
MYTQCPECGVAFRVTADILKQAAGKVRCGGCRRAFNALDYLSESKPEAPLQDDPEPQLPELIPEPDDDLDADRTPRTISAAQSAALLKTLDQLAGEDIRIEDTGVEWRVLDLDDDDSQTAQDEHAAVEPADTNTGSLKFILQDAETGDSEETQEPDAPVSADVDGETDIEDAGRIEYESAPAADEMRFDDNTQLPDDFGSDVEEEPEAEPMIEVSEPPGDPDDPQVDLALGDPDEWQDLLGEVGGEDAPESADEAAEFSREGSEAVASVDIESRSPADGPLDTDTQFAIQAETLGIDLSGLHTLMDEDDLDQYPETGADQSLYKEDDTETSIDEDLIAAAFEVEAAARDTSEARKPADTDDDLAGDTELEDDEADNELTRDEELEDDDTDDELTRDGELDGDDIDADRTGGTKFEDGDTEDELTRDVEFDDAEIDDDLAGDTELEDGETEDELTRDVEFDDAEIDTDDDLAGDTELEDDKLDGDDVDADLTGDTELEDAEIDDDLTRDDKLDGDTELEDDETEDELTRYVEFDDDDIDADLTDDTELDDADIDDDLAHDEALEDDDTDADLARADTLDDSELEDTDSEQELNRDKGFEDGNQDPIDRHAPDQGGDNAGDLTLPELSEEEKTINMMIDQDLLAIAVQDEEGFASTIVQKQLRGAEDIPAEGGTDKGDIAEQDESPIVETIIMEGDFVRSELDRERLADDNGAGSGGRGSRRLSMQAIKSWSSPVDHDHDDDEDQPIRRGLLFGGIALLLLLGVQAVHQSRETLATLPFFNSTLGPIYRVLGKPVSPDWDISGWRFEATKGSTDANEQRLTVYSRVGNKSEKALPYPLIHLSLTDRFEEIIGSRVVEPNEYLVGDPDPRIPVAPGTAFNAVIAVDAPSVDATGFKLNVCYRLTSGRLRCAIEDFR